MTSLEEFIREHPTKRFAKDQIILCQDDIPANVYVVKKGFVKGYDIDVNGSEQLLWLGGDKEIFPYDWLFSVVESSQFFYGAFNDCELYTIERQEFMNFLSKSPGTLLEITRKMAITFNDLVQKLAATEKPKANQKIVYVLHMLSDKFSTEITGGIGRELDVPLTQQDLANLVGLTRETVAAELKKLRRDGYITYDKLRFVVNHERLAELMYLRPRTVFMDRCRRLRPTEQYWPVGH
jgi:CRP/FNR family transcriptional regulator